MGTTNDDGHGDASAAIFEGGGVAGELMRAMDWSTTPIGPVETWPQSLRTAASIILRSKFPMFVFWGPELVQLYNDAYIPIPGAKHPRSLGAPAAETWAEVWDILGEHVRSVVEDGEATWTEDQLLMMDRHGFTEETYFTFSYSPLLDGDGVGGVFCACTETTDQVVATRRLRAVRELAEHARGAPTPALAATRAAESLASSDRDLPALAIYLVDDGRATRVSSTGFRMPSPHLPDTVALDAGADPDPWGIRQVIATREELVLTDLADRSEVLPTAPWGDLPRAVRVLPIADPTSDELAGVMIAALSPRRRLDEEYETFLHLVRDTVAKGIADARARQREKERVDALAELNRAKSEFFSNVSHEFRTPLTLMLGPLEDALGTGLDPAATERVLRNATRLLKLVNSLLDFSRLEAGRLQPAFRATDLGTFTEELASVFRSAIEAAGLRYDVGCAPLSAPVHVDRDLWEKIVLNLLSNALKFTHEGEIRVELREEGDHVVLEVADTGAGISAAHLPHLFERFYRVEGVPGRSHEGSGIGLALVHELVALHGGDIDVESEPGRGTTFRVRIPAGTTHLEPASIAPSGDWTSSRVMRQAYVAEATSWLTSQDLVTGELEDIQALDVGATIGDEVLVVDDNADMRRYLAELLSVHWRVRVASDGEMALEAIRERAPDLVVTDVMMPRLDGFELLAAIRSDPALAQIPVVVLSARAAEEAAAQGLEAGADDYVVKPFSAAQLTARVRANLELSRMRSKLAAERSRAELLAGVSHEMQTPLAIVLGALSQLRDDGLSGDDRRLLLDRSLARGRHLRLLVQQFLDHASIEAGEPVVVQIEAVPLRAMVDDVLSITDQRGRADVDIDGELQVAADRDRIAQIVANLVGNALRYSDGEVRIRAQREGDHVVLSVADDGKGLSATERERVFERFYRGEAARGSRGAGLGLYVSRVLAEAQGGTLVAARPDRGARFDLRLPAAGPLR